MSELQAALEFQVELSKFFNVDLFQRGYYQIRAALKTAPKVPIKVEVSLPRNSESDLVFPASVINGVAVSKTFQILYRNEDVTINDVILFKAQMLVDANKVEESIQAADLNLGIELWFTDEEMGPDHQEKLQCISERVIKLNFSTSTGCHHHLPLLFDYFHLCVICVTVHGSLIALHQPYMNIAGRPPRQAWSKDQNSLESVYFGGINPRPSSTLSLQSRLAGGVKVHENICMLLLSAYESLQCSLQPLMSKLPAYQQISIDYIDCRKKLNDISEKIKSFKEEEEFLQTAQSDVATLCAENVIMWQQYIEIVTLNEKITHQLAKEHHLQRVKRFSEGFFTQEHPKQAATHCYDASTHSHADLVTLIKASEYFNSFPPLMAECTEIDGDPLTTPIIFEDVFCDIHPVKQFTTSPKDVTLRRDRTLSQSSYSSLETDSTSSPKFKRSSKLNFIKNIKPETFKRPSNFEDNVKGSVAGYKDPKECTLVGYRKRDSNTFQPIMELGTLSPSLINTSSQKELKVSSSNKPPLHNAASMPTLVGQASLDHSNNTGSMPDLHRANSFRTSRGSKSKHTVSSLATDKLSVASLKLDEKKPTIEDPNISSNSGNISSDKETDSGVASTSNPSICNDSSLTERKDDVSSLTDVSNNESEKERLTETNDVVKRLENDLTEAIGDSDEIDGQNENCSSSKSSSPNSDVDIPINGIELDPDISNDEILEQLGVKHGDDDHDQGTNHEKHETNGAANDIGAQESSDSFRELSVDATHSDAIMSERCTLMELLTEEFTNTQDKSKADKVGIGRLDVVTDQPRSEYSLMPQSGSPDRSHLLVSPVADATINFITAKEKLRRNMNYTGHVYSDFPSQASTIPYFWPPDMIDEEDEGIHLIVCVHGLDGNSADLRLVRTYLEMALPGSRLDFLMSERNQPDTFADIDVMTDRLVAEILYHIEMYGMKPARISFVGHSLGNLIIRSALSSPKLAPLLPRLYTLLSLSGPHLGSLYNSSGLVNMGMWFMQKWKKSGSLLQLSLKDHPDPRQSFLYKLSQKPGLEFFRNILLVSSQQDRYVPYHSSRIELCKPALKDSSGLGSVYEEMVNNILQPIVYKSDITFVRYDVFHALPNTANSLIGRAAHIAVLDSEIFIEKFMTVAALKYFK